MKRINVMMVIFMFLLYSPALATKEMFSIKGAEFGREDLNGDSFHTCLFSYYPEKKEFEVMFDNYWYKCSYKETNWFNTSFYNCNDVNSGSEFEFEWWPLGSKRETCVYFMRKAYK